MADDTTYHAKTVAECYAIATAEAERYQRLANRVLHKQVPAMEVYRVLSKRDAASRIARMIRFGHAEVGQNHTERDVKDGE